MAAAVTELIGQAAPAGYRHVVATRDHHVDPGGHFADHPDFVRSWPAHCVAGTEGVGFHPNFAPAVTSGAVDAVFDKGAYAAAYSGFEGTDENGTPLARWLREREIDEVDVVGIATDHCVRATALDAVREGFRTQVLLDLTAGVSRGRRTGRWRSCGRRVWSCRASPWCSDLGRSRPEAGARRLPGPPGPVRRGRPGV